MPFAEPLPSLQLLHLPSSARGTLTDVVIKALHIPSRVVPSADGDRSLRLRFTEPRVEGRRIPAAASASRLSAFRPEFSTLTHACSAPAGPDRPERVDDGRKVHEFLEQRPGDGW